MRLERKMGGSAYGSGTIPEEHTLKSQPLSSVPG
jgi:hypothetical protein